MSTTPPDDPEESDGEQHGDDGSNGCSIPVQSDACGLDRFARNRYFHGKLLTARDMELEQDYNVGRQNTFARNVAGEGIVCGLTVDVQADDETVEVDVEPGYALDSCGRPVVVADGADESFGPDEWKDAALTHDEADPVGISLYVRFTECWTEKVPSPGSEDACGEDCEYNRIVEDYEIEVRRGAPKNPKPVYEVEFPTSDDFDLAEPAEVPGRHHPELQRMATSYNKNVEDEIERPCEGDEEGMVFLGHYTRPEDTWERQDVPRTYAYDNELLYAAIARHATNFDNPHEVVASLNDRTGNLELYSPEETIAIDPDGEGGRINLDVSEQFQASGVTIEGVGPDESGNIDLTSLNETIDFDTPDEGEGHWVSIELEEFLRDRINDNFARLGQHDLYVRDKTLKFAIESFYKVAAVFVESQANDLAVEAIRIARDAIENQHHKSRQDYFDAVSSLTDVAVDIRSAVSGSATAATYNRYDGAVDELVTLRDDLAPDDDSNYWSVSELELIELTLALDWVCETAGWLRQSEETMTLPGDHEITGSIAPDIIRRSGYHFTANYGPSESSGTGGAGGGFISNDVIDAIEDYPSGVALTDVQGIATGRAGMLQNAGITSVTELLAADPQEVADETDLSVGTVEQLQDNARSQYGQ